MKVDKAESHVRTCTMVFDHRELERVVAEFVAEEAGVRLGAPGVSTKVSFEDATEGSPPYRVGTRARVVITQDMLPQTNAVEEAL
jgi:hypothetical protein